MAQKKEVTYEQAFIHISQRHNYLRLRLGNTYIMTAYLR